MKNVLLVVSVFLFVPVNSRYPICDIAVKGGITGPLRYFCSFR